MARQRRHTDKYRASEHEGGGRLEKSIPGRQETQGTFEEWKRGKSPWNTEEEREPGTSWLVWLVGLGVRGFYLLLKERGTYR